MTVLMIITKLMAKLTDGWCRGSDGGPKQRENNSIFIYIYTHK